MTKTATKKGANASKEPSKAKGKGTKPRLVPKLKLDVEGDFRFGTFPEATGRQATKLVAFTEAKKEWADACRKARIDGESMPDFPVSKVPDPNSGSLLRKPWEGLVKRWNGGEDDVLFPPTYSPVLIELVKALECSHIRKSNKTSLRRPGWWDDEKYGSWNTLDGDGEYTWPSRWYRETDSPRRVHAIKAEELVENPDKNIFQVGSARYVVGNGTHGGAAVFLCNAHAEGKNYGHIERQRKRLSLAGQDVKDIVFRIEDRANCGGAVRLTIDTDGNEICFMPGQAMTPGRLVSGGSKTIDAKDIRKMAADGIPKGVKVSFQAITIKDPVVCPVVSFDEKLWPAVKEAEGGKGVKKLRDRKARGSAEKATPEGKTRTNARTLCRVIPTEFHPFGLKSLQMGMIPYFEFDVDGNMSQGVVIGARSNFYHNVTGQEARRMVTAEDEPKSAAKKPAAKKSVKKSAAKKSAAKKRPAKKRAAAKPKPAPAVEAVVEATVETEPDVVETTSGQDQPDAILEGIMARNDEADSE